LSHLINITPRPKVDVELGDEVWELDIEVIRRVSGENERWLHGYGGKWHKPGCRHEKHRGQPFLISVIKDTIGTGHGRNVGPVDVVVSALDTVVEEGGGVNYQTYLT
jgi:hypothetical protein